ncbi:DoxX family protein [Candidatus Zixiibacteriota bacterium]|nr:DoxX family protein [candidate division Zixibacteria bacterium]
MFMNKFIGQTYGIMRIITGFLILWHGSQKLFSFPPPGQDIPAFVMTIAGPIELFGGILIAVGLWTRYVAFLASGLMAFAYWIAHGTQAFLPIVNQGELAVLYCFVFLYISANGGGIWSIDAVIASRGGAQTQSPDGRI